MSAFRILLKWLEQSGLGNPERKRPSQEFTFLPSLTPRDMSTIPPK